MLINGFELLEDAAEMKSPRTRLATDNAKVTRHMQARNCSVVAIFRAGKKILGYPVLRTDSLGIFGDRRWIERRLPHAYPVADIFEDEAVADGFIVEERLFATSLQADPLGKAGDLDDFNRPTYSAWRVQLDYETPDYHILPDANVLAEAGPLWHPTAELVRPDEGDALSRGWHLYSRYVSKHVTSGAWVLSIRQGVVKFVGDPPDAPGTVPIAEGHFIQPILEGYMTVQCKSTITYGWMQVPLGDNYTGPALPGETVNRTLGKTNNATFDNHDAGTLLLLDYKTVTRRHPLGFFMFDVFYEMAALLNEDPVTAEVRGWNSLLRAVDGKLRYWPISTDGAPPLLASNNMVYPSADFTALFRPPQD